MSSNAKRAKEAPSKVLTNSDGRRYVDIAEVIESELRRIESKKDCAAPTKSDRAQGSNGASGASGASGDNRH